VDGKVLDTEYQNGARGIALGCLTIRAQPVKEGDRMNTGVNKLSKLVFRYAFRFLFFYALTSASFGQSFPYIDHPGSGSSGGWTTVGNVTFSNLQYGVGDSGGVTHSCTPMPTIAGLGTQPAGTAVLQVQADGTASSITKVLPASATPQNTFYEVDVAVTGLQSCDPRGCGSNGPTYPAVQVSVDGTPRTITHYPAYRQVIGTPKLITVNVTSLVTPAIYHVVVNPSLGAVSHSITISAVTKPTGDAGGILYVGQVAIYPRATGTTIQGVCAYSLDGLTYTNVGISAQDIEHLAVACQAFNGNVCTGNRINLKPDIVYPNAAGQFVGCGQSGTIQCDLLDIN
jgi:hypothetical protein